MPAIAFCHAEMHVMDDRLREQGGTPPRSLLQVLSSPKIMNAADIHCRSALAREDGVSLGQRQTHQPRANAAAVWYCSSLGVTPV